MSVLLLSGGLDSAVCLALERPHHALFVDYGQPHMDQELPRARALAGNYDVHMRIARASVPGWEFERRAEPTMLTLGRNLVLVSLAATLGAPVVMGCTADDREVDCRPEFFAPIVDVRMPLIEMRKAEVGQLAHELGIEPDATWSCYYPTAKGEQCGECDACKGRERAFARRE